MFENIQADLKRFCDTSEDTNIIRILVRGIMSQGFQALLVYRFFRWFHERRIPTQPFRFFVERTIEIITGISIPAETSINKGLRIHHFGGIIFHSKAKIGKYCTIYQGTTIGDKGGWGGAPSIGNNVTIGAGAKILGEIKIGNNVIIGANAVVTKSLPANVIAGGIPATILGENTRRHDHEEK